MPIANLVTTDTFRTWYTRTNEIAHFVNYSVVQAGGVVSGVFTLAVDANTSLNVANALFVNTSVITARANATFTANLTIASSSNLVTISANSFIVQPLSGTIVNTPLRVNAAATFVNLASFNAGLSITAGNIALTGAFTSTGDITTNAGAIFARSLMFTAGAAISVNMADPDYNNFAPSGLANAQILNANTTGNIRITGIQAPTFHSTSDGQARILYLQNTGTGKVTLMGANSGSTSTNQFQIPNDASVDIPAGGSLALIYNNLNKRWQLLGVLSTLDMTFGSNVAVGKSLNVTEQIIGGANAAFGNTFYVNSVTGRVGVKTSNPGYDFHTVGTSYFSGVATFGSLFSTAANSALGANAMFVDSGSKNVTLANTIVISSNSASFIKTLTSNSITSTAAIISSLSGVASFAGTNATLAGTLGVTGVSTLGVLNAGNTTVGTLAATGTFSAPSATIAGTLSGAVATFSGTVTAGAVAAGPVNGTVGTFSTSIIVGGGGSFSSAVISNLSFTAPVINGSTFVQTPLVIQTNPPLVNSVLGATSSLTTGGVDTLLLSATAPSAGWYQIDAQLIWLNNPSSSRPTAHYALDVRLDSISGTLIGSQAFDVPFEGAAMSTRVSTLHYLTANQVVRMIYNTTTSAIQALGGDIQYTRLKLTRLF